MYYIGLCRFTSHNYASDYFSQALKNHCEQNSTYSKLSKIAIRI